MSSKRRYRRKLEDAVRRVREILQAHGGTYTMIELFNDLHPEGFEDTTIRIALRDLDVIREKEGRTMRLFLRRLPERPR